MQQIIKMVYAPVEQELLGDGDGDGSGGGAGV